MIVIRNFNPADLLYINPPPEVAEQGNHYDILKTGEARAKNGPCLTICAKGKAVACGGLCFLCQGTAELWARIDKNAPAGALVICKRQVDAWIKKYNLTRVQAMAPASWYKGRRFLAWMGMELEGILHKMGPNGIDQALYARVM
jgi:hypothetical protein